MLTTARAALQQHHHLTAFWWRLKTPDPTFGRGVPAFHFFLSCTPGSAGDRSLVWAVTAGLTIREWFGLEGTIKFIQFQPPAMGRDTFYYKTRLLQAPSKLSYELRTKIRLHGKLANEKSSLQAQPPALAVRNTCTSYHPCPQAQHAAHSLFSRCTSGRYYIISSSFSAVITL